MLGDLVGAIKKAALQAYDNSDPSTWMIGKVTKESPLQIQIEQRLTLDSDNLILTSTGKDAIKKGRMMLLIRQQGGQKFIVIDRVVS